LRGAENSEVSPVDPFVAVAVIVCPTGTFVAGEKVKETLPDESVVTDFCPVNFFPSSVPAGLE
jgi:hypothetical protein